MLQPNLDLTITARSCVRCAISPNTSPEFDHKNCSVKNVMANHVIQDAHASRGVGPYDDRFCHLWPPPCCWACSFTDSSPRTLLAAMKLEEPVRKWEAGGTTRAEGQLQSTVPATKSTHAFCLDTGHPEEVLGVGEVVGKLSELRMQLGL